VCPPATLTAGFAATARGSVLRSAGRIATRCRRGPTPAIFSAEMLRDAGATAVMVGHSERRQYHGESDAAVRAKALAARRAGLVAIICVGETSAERDAGRARAVVSAQLDGSLPESIEQAAALVIAYEPVWAIGSGVIPTADDVAEIHGFIGSSLRRGMARWWRGSASSTADRSNRPTPNS